MKAETAVAALGAALNEIGPKAFREYFRVDPRGAKA